MSLKRTAILLAVSHANHHHTATNNSAWNSLTSGNINSHSNASDFYTAANFNHSNKSYNNQGMRAMRPGVGGFNGNVNVLLGGWVALLICLCYVYMLLSDQSKDDAVRCSENPGWRGKIVFRVESSGRLIN